MRIQDYIDKQVQHLDKTSERIRDFRVFDFNYIPEQPLMREEAKPVIDACLRYLKTGIANHLFLFGSRGSGKTLMVRYIQRLLAKRRDAQILYVNCRQHNTSFKVLAHLLGVRPRGCSLDELWYRFCGDYRSPLIFILDEVDLLSEKDRHKDLLYLLARSSNNYMAVLLSNHPKFLNRLDESIRSSLQPATVHFRNYDAPQIRQILVDRARLGLRRMPPAVPAEIAALTVRGTNSDVRVAIKTLYYAAMEESWTNVRELFSRARQDLVTDILTHLNEHNLVTLKAAIDTPEPFVKAVYDRYRRIARDEHEEPISYVYFYTNLSYLQSIGLIVLLSTKVGRAYTYRVQLLFDAELLEGIWQERFG